MSMSSIWPSCSGSAFKRSCGKMTNGSVSRALSQSRDPTSPDDQPAQTNRCTRSSYSLARCVRATPTQPQRINPRPAPCLTAGRHGFSPFHSHTVRLAWPVSTSDPSTKGAKCGLNEKAPSGASVIPGATHCARAHGTRIYAHCSEGVLRQVFTALSADRQAARR